MIMFKPFHENINHKRYRTNEISKFSKTLLLLHLHAKRNLKLKQFNLCCIEMQKIMSFIKYTSLFKLAITFIRFSVLFCVNNNYAPS